MTSGARFFTVLLALGTIAGTAYGTLELLQPLAPEAEEQPATPGTSPAPRSGSGSGEKGTVERVSLLRPKGFRKVIDRIRKEAGSKTGISTLALRPERADVIFNKGQGRVVMQIDQDGNVKFRIRQQIRDDSTFTVTRLKARTPERLTRRIGRRIGRARAPVDYMVAVRFGPQGGMGWSVFLKSGEPRHYVADAEGRSMFAPGKDPPPKDYPWK